MKNFSSLVFCILLFSACQTTRQQITVDYLSPAEINFPTELKRVAVVDNMPFYIDTTSETRAKFVTDGIIPEAIATKGNSTLTAEALAGALAEANYFDEIVICDSALRKNDVLRTEQILTQKEVQELTNLLDVDFLISVEEVNLQSTHYIGAVPEWNCYQGVVDMKVNPKFHIYIPTRKAPLLTVNTRDSIFWEQLGTTEGYVRANMIKKKQMIEESSAFAGTLPIKYILPHWSSATRYLYTGGSVQMRDAAIHVRENNWNEAFNLWEAAYKHTKNKKQKMRIANNIALYYETKDDFEQAIEWATKANKWAYEVDRIEGRDMSNTSIYDVMDYVETARYLDELNKRKEGLSQLNIQMQRIQEDF